MKKGRKKFSLKEVTLIVVFSSLFMFFLGGLSVYNKLGGINYNVLGNDKDLKKFIGTYESLIYNYYGEIDNSSIIAGAIDGMYKSLKDPYTTYLDSNATKEINDLLDSQYTGLGIVLEDIDNKAIIKSVLNGTPADNAGLRIGDIIVKLNDIDVSEINSLDIRELIKASDKDINITINRDNKNMVFKLKKEEILIPTVKQEILEYRSQKIGYIFLEIFNDSADIQFKDSLYLLEESGINSLIIDLRDNSGGYLEVSKNIAELFLKKGDIIYSLENKSREVVFEDITNESRDYKIAVIVNSKTASAAEVLAASLKYSYGANIVGTKTFGKGKVQHKSEFLDGSSIKYTTAKWLMPNGKCLDTIGLQPDFEIAFDRSNIIEGNLYSDNQLLYTLKILVD